MKRVAREVWAKRVEQWKASGKTAEVFAAELGLNARSLKWWKWQLGALPPVTRSSRNTAAITKTPIVSPLTFVEMTAAVVSDAIEVVLPSSVRVAVRPGFDDGTLHRVLDVLERRR